MNKPRLFLLLLMITAFSAFFIFDIQLYFSLDFINQQKQQLFAYYQQDRLSFAAGYFLLYILVTALSLPGAGIMTLAAGAIFGFWLGWLLTSFASSIGATLALLASRFLLRDWVQARFGKHLQGINQGIEKEGAFYLFALRLVPMFPFFMVNLLMGLTPIRVVTYYWVSQLGMLAVTAVFVNAGMQLAEVDSFSDIFSPGLLLSFALLGLCPLLAKRMLEHLKQLKVLKQHRKPKHFDTNLVVIGAGSGGLVSAYIAATVKAKVTLIERHQMGGDCLNTGCVPSKALIRSARIADYFRRSKEFGLRAAPTEVDFPAVMQRVHRIIKTIAPHDSVARYSELGVDCVQGDARIISPWQVAVNDTVINTRNIIIATGGRPGVPVIDGLEQIDYLTSDTIWGITKLPKRLLVIGSGPIGCELAQAFQRLGAQVTMVVRGDRIMRKEDDDVASHLLDNLQNSGITILLKHKPLVFELVDDEQVLTLACGSEQTTLAFDKVLFATGRQANAQALGLDALGIDTTDEGTIAVDETMQTSIPGIYACGDITGPYQFTHMAAHQAWYASVNALFGNVKKFKVDYSVVPWATFTDPEVARVGLNEQEARSKNIAYELTRFDIDDLDRAIADEEAHGFIKVLTPPGSDKILGVTIVGYHASELISEYVMAMKHGLGLNKILGTIHIYPTLSEANKFAAGEWKKAHAPQFLLSWAKRFHQWRRG